MKESLKTMYCENCNKETTHVIREDMLEMEQECKNCHRREEVVKTFF